MAFQIKSFAAIAASMINYARATQKDITDFSVGSVARTILEAPAIEMEELYQRMLAGILEAIPASVYRAFGFDPLEAGPARGFVEITFAEPLIEPYTVRAGAVFAAGETLRFVADEEVIAPVGSTWMSVPVTASTVGAATNLGAGGISELLNGYLPAGATLGSSPMIGGRDAEPESERQQRFAAFIRSISRGTVESVLFAVRSAVRYADNGAPVEYVSRVAHVEVPGYMAVYIHGSSGAASAALVARAQALVDGYEDANGERVPGYRPAGIVIEVLPMAVRTIDVALSVGLARGVALASVQDRIRTALSAVIAAVPSGGRLLLPALSDAVLRIPGIESCVVNGTANIPCGPHEVLALGALSVEEA